MTKYTGADLIVALHEIREIIGTMTGVDEPILAITLDATAFTQVTTILALGKDTRPHIKLEGKRIHGRGTNRVRIANILVRERRSGWRNADQPEIKQERG